jgi:titin
VNFNNGATSNLVLDNLISGNRSDAVSLYHTGTNGNILQGNYIGTDVSGTTAVPNTSAAIWIGEGASHTLIGGVGEGEGNLISGNTGDAISINHAETTGTVIQGNFIGTDVTGSATLPNNSNGIVLVSGTHDNLIGGTETGAGNVISGNFGDGVILVDGGTSGNSVQHNFIGTDLTGTIALGNWNRGLYIGGGASDNLVGGNVISGNGAAGVRLADSGTTGNQIQGNFIGTDGTGLNPLGNGYVGIRLTDGAANNMIGGTEPGAGNIIAFNAATGIAMSGDDVTGNALLSNSVFSNAGLGIDLGEDDITLNDPLDRDPGPNNLQNFPIIISVTRKGTSMMINGLLASAPKTTYRLEFFRNDACDPSGYGEGQTFLGFTTVTTNPVGLANFKLTLPVSLRDAFVTATATDPGGNTSEFSKCFGPVK